MGGMGDHRSDHQHMSTDGDQLLVSSEATIVQSREVITPAIIHSTNDDHVQQVVVDCIETLDSDEGTDRILNDTTTNPTIIIPLATYDRTTNQTTTAAATIISSPSVSSPLPHTVQTIFNDDHHSTQPDTDSNKCSPPTKRKKTYGRRSERALRDIRELGQVDADKKTISCNYCHCSQYLNVTKFKLHIVDCGSCPFEVKEKYVHTRDLFNLDNHGMGLSLQTKGFLANCQKRFCEAVVESNFSLSAFHTDKWISFFKMISPSFKVPNAREITADSPDDSNLEVSLGS